MHARRTAYAAASTRDPTFVGSSCSGHGCSPAGGPTPGAAVHVPAGGDEHVRYDEEWTNEHLMRRAKTILQPRTGVRMEGHLCSRRSVRYLIREGKTLALAWVTMPGGAEIGQSVATAERQPLDTSGEPPSKSCVAGASAQTAMKNRNQMHAQDGSSTDA
ncbi:unnamed protein product [Symbiodinium microadriaticum]|nr:unnamed protein product [Symbiodinium microadriaticum]